MAAKISMSVFWAIMPCELEVDTKVSEKYCLHLQGLVAKVCSYETLVSA
jgi:hypothetical protein